MIDKNSNGLRTLQMYRAVREMYLLEEQRKFPSASLDENTNRVLKRMYQDSPETLSLLESRERLNVGK